ncbi:hypothetical protein BY996DRAFT_6408125 [Phakopsora pachyrhizi]|nr:hypothetical protein BY996DRAFT_6408125 [Phakopsora pachyrhizi]
MLVILLVARNSFDLIRAAPALQVLGHADSANIMKTGAHLQDAKVLEDVVNAKNIDQGIEGLRLTNSLSTSETTPLLKNHNLHSDVVLPNENPYVILKPIDAPKDFLDKSKAYMKNSWDKLSNSVSNSPLKTYGQKFTDQGKTAYNKISDSLKNRFSKPPKKPSPVIVDEKPVDPHAFENPAWLNQPSEVFPVVLPKPNLLTKTKAFLRNSWNNIASSASKGPLARLYRKLRGPIGKLFTKIREAFTKSPKNSKPILEDPIKPSKIPDTIFKAEPNLDNPIKSSKISEQIPKAESKLDNPIKLTKTGGSKPSLYDKTKNSIIDSWTNLSSSLSNSALQKAADQIKNGFNKAKNSISNRVKNTPSKGPEKILPDGPPIPARPEYADNFNRPVPTLKLPEKAIINKADGPSNLANP